MAVRNSDDLAEALPDKSDAHKTLSFVLSVVYAGCRRNSMRGRSAFSARILRARS
jgi:hypothetical protein